MRIELLVPLIACLLLVVVVIAAFFARLRAVRGRRWPVLIMLVILAAYVLVSNNRCSRALLSPALPPDLVPGAELAQRVFRNANLIAVDASGSNLSGSDFEGANLYRSDLSGADLEGANLARTDLDRANLEGAKLHDADLTGASLKGSLLANADLRGARLAESDLMGAIGLTSEQLHQADLDRETTRLPNVRNFSWDEYERRRSEPPAPGPIPPPEPQPVPPPLEPAPEVQRPSAEPVLLRGINFDPGEAGLDDSARVVLDSIGEALGLRKELRVRIVGHTDSIGDHDSNGSLSEKRARAVLDYLVSLGVDRSRLRAEGGGETEPVATNASEAGRALNRRVELFVSVEP